MWWLFKTRGEDDLRRLVSAYRCFLKVAERATYDRATAGAGGDGAWRGGFGQAYQVIFNGPDGDGYSLMLNAAHHF